MVNGRLLCTGAYVANVREPAIKRHVLQPTPDVGTGMPAQRKVFRIEESVHAHAGGEISIPVPQDETALRHHELMTEIMALRALLAPRPSPKSASHESGRDQITKAHDFKTELDLIHEAIRRTKLEMGGLEKSGYFGPQIARVGRELDAVVDGTERATQNILKEAEAIDQIASTLTSLLKGEYAQGLAQDMRDHVVKIFEACNFQDLTGQRIGKVVTTLKFIEDHIIRMRDIWSSIEHDAPPSQAEQIKTAGSDDGLLNGPRLAGDPGHSSQAEIDEIFKND